MNITKFHGSIPHNFLTSTLLKISKHTQQRSPNYLSLLGIIQKNTCSKLNLDKASSGKNLTLNGRSNLLIRFWVWLEALYHLSGSPSITFCLLIKISDSWIQSSVRSTRLRLHAIKTSHLLMIAERQCNTSRLQLLSKVVVGTVYGSTGSPGS